MILSSSATSPDNLWIPETQNYQECLKSLAMRGFRHSGVAVWNRLSDIIAVATKASSLKSRHVNLGYHQRRLGAVNLGLFVGVDLNSVTEHLYS